MAVAKKLHRVRASVARPGVPLSYSAAEASKLLGFTHRSSILKMLKKGLIHGGKQPITMKVRSGRRWCIPRSEIIRLARTLNKDRPIALARIISASQPKGALFVVSDNPSVRSCLGTLEARFVSSLFGLGGMLAIDASWCVIIDWATVGRFAAYDVAERLQTLSDRPFLIGLSAEDSTYDPPKGLWDSFIKRPFRPIVLQREVGRYRKLIYG